jgi:hypothetical protein
MPWGRVDDDFYDHPKVVNMPAGVRNAACGLYWRAVSYCNRYLTDGRLSEAALVKLDARPEEIKALLMIAPGMRFGLFEKCPGKGSGYRIHDFLAKNKSRDEVYAEREAKVEAGRAGGLQSGRIRAQKAQANAKQGASVVLPRREAEGKQGASRSTKQTRSKREAPGVELPSRPVPLTTPIPPQAGARPRSRRKKGDTPRSNGNNPRLLREGNAQVDAKVMGDLAERTAAWNAAHPGDQIPTKDETIPDWMAGS